MVRENSEIQNEPNFWPLFAEPAETENDLTYLGYAKKISGDTFKIINPSSEEENIFYDKSGVLEKALEEENKNIIRKIITH